ncbi:helix-turn-helix domain-containing protein [Thalassospira alkalitolerans]|uniref:helix-turn-helix domain-containing protein n=1 Tax=Thalassospira alkalitolerans TaxID=1293890 RepID=UPI003AA9538A
MERATNDNVVGFPEAAQDRSGRFLIPERLYEARVASRLNQTELAALVGVSRQAVSSYEMGNKSPEPPVMRKLAEALEQPISYFTKTDLESFGKRSPNFFRKIGPDTKRRNQACEVYSDWLSRTAFAFDQYVNYPSVDIPQFEPENGSTGEYVDEEIERIAEQVREYFGLGLGPISNMVRLLESRGVIVCRMRMHGEKVEAFSFWSGKRPFVFMASDKNSAARARFDVAHELGHLCLHRWVSPEDIEDKARLKVIEAEANRFAGAFLLPRKSFVNEVYSPRVEAFVDLKVRWKVAIQAMIYRCKNLGLFDERQVTLLYKQISYKQWRIVEPHDGPTGLPLEQPVLLRKVAEVVFKNKLMSVDELKARLSIAEDTIEQLVGLDAGKLKSPTADGLNFTLKP